VSDTPTDPGYAPGEACPTCGYAVPSGARFCPNCGAPRDPGDAPPADDDATGVMAPVAVAAGTVPAERRVVEQPPPMRDRPWPWALIIGVPVVLIALLLVILALQGGGDGGGETTTTTGPSTTAVSTSVTQRSVTTRAPDTTRPVQTTEPPTTEPPATTEPPTTVPPTTVTVP
jgi:hypothetical protein